MLPIPPISPFRFADPRLSDLDREEGYKQFNAYQDVKCYLQKWVKTDTTTLQILSEYVPTVTLVDAETNADLAELDVELKSTSIIGYAFKVYEVPVVFADLLGVYYLRIDWNDGTSDNTRTSEPFEVAESWPKTFLVNYRNSENNFGAVFSTGVTFTLRVDGTLANYAPEADDIIYNDQNRNTTLLDSLPSRSFTLFVGESSGVPNWVLDKIHRVLSCNNVEILETPFNGQFTKKDGATWEVIREDQYAFVGATIEVVPTVNRFTERYLTEGDGLGGKGKDMLQRVHNLTDVAGDVSVVGKFTTKSLLEKICIVKTGANFNLTVGVTDGGTEIAEFLITDVITTVLVNHLFNEEVTLFLGGITEASFVSIIYKQLDDETTAGGGTVTGGLGKGATIIFTFNSPEELDAAFDLVSGLGRESSTAWNKWAIADGRNTTFNFGGIMPMGYKYGEYEIDALGGNKEITLSVNQLPPHDHDYRTAVGTDYARGNVGSDFFANNKAAKTAKTGAGAPINILNPYRVVLWVTKIAD